MSVMALTLRFGPLILNHIVRLDPESPGGLMRSPRFRTGMSDTSFRTGLRHAFAALIPAVFALGLSDFASKQAYSADFRRTPNVVFILTDDKYQWLCANTVKHQGNSVLSENIGEIRIAGNHDELTRIQSS
jgi:hypothetical protein